MSSTKNRNEFGKDLGLVHQAVISGREVGADADFWSYLARDKKLFGQVVKTVKAAKAKWLSLGQEDIAAIREWTERLTKSDCPYPESETYYTRSSHSEYNQRYNDLHYRKFGGLWERASQSKQIAEVCKLVEACFVISYLLSGYHSAEQDMEGTKKNWMHGPFSITTYFHDLWGNDGRVNIGCFFTYDNFRNVDGMKDVYNLTQKKQDWGKATINKIVPRLREIKAEQIKVLEQKLAELA